MSPRTAVLQLVGEGRLSLDDTVEHWLPGVVSGNGNDGSKITVRELLQHTSGLFNYTEDLPELQSVADFQAGRFTAWTASQLVAIAMRHAPDFAPGTQWEYSNTNYILAGMIINKVTGRSWKQEVTQRIIRPLGLRDTVAPVDYPDIQGPHLDGYSDFGGSGLTIDVTGLNPSAADAAGAIISTTADLSRFYSALLGGRPLRPAQLAEMETTVPAAWNAKEDLMGLLELHGTHPDRTEISRLLIRFYESAAASGPPEIERLATTVSAWWPEILVAITTGVTNAGSEGVNQLIKTDARCAFGYRNPTNQRLRARCATTRRARGHLTTRTSGPHSQPRKHSKP